MTPPFEAHLPDTDPDCFQTCGDSSVHIDITFTTAPPIPSLRCGSPAISPRLRTRSA